MACIFWHSILAFYLTFCSDFLFNRLYSGILSGILSDIWFCHSIWHSFWHSFSHLLWHSFWHLFWHSMLAFYLASILPFSLALVLPSLNRERSHLRSGNAHCNLHGACGWNPVAPASTEICRAVEWMQQCPLWSGAHAHCDLALAVDVWHVPTEILSSRLRRRRWG